MQRRISEQWWVTLPMLLFLAAPAIAAEFPAWAFPGCPVKSVGAAPDAGEPRSVPGSDQRFSAASIRIRSQVHDWFPGEHAPPPSVVTRNRADDQYACGYCHLPDGAGRPENAKIAGLPAAYIIAQVKALRGHERRPSLADWPPTSLMVASTRDLTDEDLESVANYFSAQKVRSFVHVVEQPESPPHDTACFIYAPTSTGTKEPATTIVEMPADMSRFELRDPHVPYDAFVPPGSVERGRALAEAGRDLTQPCSACHGPGLRGDATLPGPPLAGRFPTYLFRQLYAIQSGTRGGTAVQPMLPVVAHLSLSDMVDLAAYAASLPP